MKILFGIFLICFSTLFGGFLAKKYTLRRKFFEDFDDFNKTFLTNLTFKQDNLFDFINIKYKDSDFYVLTKKIIDNLEYKKITYLNDEENDLIINYLKSLGKTDTDSQIKSTENIIKIIEKNLTESKESEKKYRPMYIKLGFFFGLLLFIIIL